MDPAIGRPDGEPGGDLEVVRACPGDRAPPTHGTWLSMHPVADTQYRRFAQDGAQ